MGKEMRLTALTPVVRHPQVHCLTEGHDCVAHALWAKGARGRYSLSAVKVCVQCLESSGAILKSGEGSSQALGDIEQLG